MNIFPGNCHFDFIYALRSLNNSLTITYSLFLTITLFVCRLRDGSVLLEEAIEILSFEPEGTIEASRLKIAKDFRVYLGKIVKDLEEYNKLVKTEDKCTEDEKIRDSEDQESKKEKVIQTSIVAIYLRKIR